MKGVRVFLLVFGTCAVAAGIAALFARPFVARLLERAGDSLTDQTLRNQRDAKEFARDHEQTDCVPETFRRLAACDGFWCRMSAPDFAGLCLPRARPSPTLCDEVPQSPALAALWPTQKCLTADVEAQMCRRIYTELVMACIQPGAAGSR